jgi:hypothetical protein
MGRPRSESFTDLRENFPQLNAEDDATEEELHKIAVSSKQDNLQTTDKRHIGSVIGAGICGLIGFAIFNVIGLLPGALVGYGVGHVVGRKLKKRRSSQDYNKDKQYNLRLTCWIVYLKLIIKNKTPITTFSRLLEKALDEFRPALVMQLHSEEISKQLVALVRFLKTTPCHTSLLNSILEVEFHIKNNFNPKLTASKLRRFIIPTYHLLKLYYPSLEVVHKIEMLLNKSAVQTLLNSERCIGDLMGAFLVTKSTLSDNLLLSQLMIVEDYNKSYHQKAYSNVVRGRPASLPDDNSEAPRVRLSFKQEKCFNVMRRLYPANVSDDESEVSSESCEVSIGSPVVDRKPNPMSFSINGGMFKLNEVQMGLSTPPKVFEGFTNDLVDSEESEDEQPQVPIFEEFKEQSSEAKECKELSSEPKELIKEEEVKVAQVEVIVHPFMESFNHLLSIEAEPTGGEWKQTVNKPETKIYTKTPKDSPMCMVKAFCEVPYPLEIVFRAIWDTSVRRQWDAVFNEFKLIDTHEFHDTLYYMIKTPIGITKRDWVQRRTHMRDYPAPGNIIAHFVSIDHPGMPPIKGVIRAATTVSGYVFRSTGPSSSSLTIISQNDIKGLIPKMIVNRVSSKAPADWVKSLYKGCELALKLPPSY